MILRSNTAKFLFCWLISAGFRSIVAQTVTNPSFEGPVGAMIVPAPWTVCANTPDTQIINGTGTGINGINTPPANGSTYVCVLAGSSYQEIFSQLLPAPLIAGTGYSGSIQMFRSTTALSPSWDATSRIQFWGGNSLCAQSELLWQSAIVSNNTNWANYSFSFTPTANRSHFAIAPLHTPSSGTGASVCLDNLVLSPVLPVRSLAFDVARIGDRAEMRWNVDIGDGNYSLIIERGKDGLNFDPIHLAVGFLESHGLPMEGNYSDTHPPQGKNYYRLRIENQDGNSYASEIGMLEFRKEVQVFPNPASTGFWVELPKFQTHSILVSIRAMDGQLVFSDESKLDPTNQIQRVTFGTKLSPGIYHLSLNWHGGSREMLIGIE